MDAAAVKTRGITHLNDLILYIFSEKPILLMNQATNLLVKNDRNPALFWVNPFCRHARALVDERHARQLEQAQKKFPTVVVFLYTKIKQSKIIFLSVM